MSIPKKYYFPRINSKAELTMAQGDSVPFDVKRVFWITAISNGDIRGEHAHKKSEQMLICISGSLHIDLESKTGNVHSFDLSKANEAVYIPAQYWGKIAYTKESTVLALASDLYDEKDYIRDYHTFKSQL